MNKIIIVIYDICERCRLSVVVVVVLMFTVTHKEV